jgi:hypothetical protein
LLLHCIYCIPSLGHPLLYYATGQNKLLQAHWQPNREVLCMLHVSCLSMSIPQIWTHVHFNCSIVPFLDKWLYTTEWWNARLQ